MKQNEINNETNQCAKRETAADQSKYKLTETAGTPVSALIHSFLMHKLTVKLQKFFRAVPLQMHLYNTLCQGTSSSIIPFINTPYAFGRLLKGTQLHNWLLNDLKCIDQAYKPLYQSSMGSHLHAQLHESFIILAKDYTNNSDQ